MRPDWAQIQPGDSLYDTNTPKWAANAYGAGEDLPDVGPDDHTASNGYWTMTRVGERFVATKK